MGGAAVDDDGEVGQPLAGGLQLAFRPGGRLEDERAGRFPRQLLDDRPRLDAADLLVGVDEKDRGERRLQPQLAQGHQGVDALHQTALHVEAAGAAQDVAVDLQRHFGQRADRPDGVAMAEQELRRALVGRGVAGDEMAAGARARRVAHVVAETLELLVEDADRPGLRLRRVRGRLGGDKGGQQGDHLVPLVCKMLEDLVGGGHDGSIANWGKIRNQESGIWSDEFGRACRAAASCQIMGRLRIVSRYDNIAS